MIIVVVVVLLMIIGVVVIVMTRVSVTPLGQSVLVLLLIDGNTKKAALEVNSKAEGARGRLGVGIGQEISSIRTCTFRNFEVVGIPEQGIGMQCNRTKRSINAECSGITAAGSGVTVVQTPAGFVR